MNKSRLLALEQKFIVRDDPIEDGPEETVNLFFSADQPRLDDVINSVNIAIEQFSHYAYVKDLLSQSKEVSPHTFSFLKKEIIKSNSYLGFTDSVNIANESYHYTNSKTLALEGIGEFLKKIWNSIVNGFKWIVNKFKNLFGFGEKNTGHLRDLEKKMTLVNREIDEIIRGFPNMDSTELQQFHPLFISEACRQINPILHERYSYLQRYKKYVNINQPSLSIENAFDLSAKELQLAINNILSIIGNKSPTSVFLKSLSGRGDQLDEALDKTNITQFSEYQDYVRNLKTARESLGGVQGILTYDKSNKAFSNFHLPNEGIGNIAYFIPMLLSISPWFITLNKAETKEDSVFKDNVLVFKGNPTDTSGISDNEIVAEHIDIVTPNALLTMTKQYYASYKKCFEGIETLGKEQPNLENLAKSLSRFDDEGVKLDMIEVLNLVLKTIKSYELVSSSLNAYLTNLNGVFDSYYEICLKVHTNIAKSTKKEEVLIPK